MIKQHPSTISGLILFVAFVPFLCCGDEEAGETAAKLGVYDSARYAVIVERAPFGADPLTDEDDKKESAAVKNLERNYRLCFLLESQSGEIRAGFENQKAKKGESKSVVLRVGESLDSSMKLTAIDLKNSSATLEYQGKEITFDLSKPKVAAKPAPTSAPQTPQRRLGAGFRRTTPPEPTPQPEQASEELAEKRQQTRAELQAYQMEVLRQGMPPLPIQLTPEQDSQLVEEGVLPPMEQ